MYIKTIFIFLFFALRAGAADLPPPSRQQAIAPNPPILQEDTDRTKVAGRPSRNSRNGFVGIYSNAEYTPLVDLINKAQRTVDIEIYEMADPGLRQALRKAIARKVKIRVVKDPTPLGASCDYFGEEKANPSTDCLDQKKLVAEIRASGGRFEPFVKKELCGKDSTADERCFQHGKMVLIDRENANRRMALLSTGNFNSSNLCNLGANPSVCNRDYTYVTRDYDVVVGLSRIFAKDIEGKRYDLAAYLEANPALKDKLTVSPFSKRPLLDFIQSATSSIQLQNQYMKDKDINEALIKAAQRGVKVQMMMASDCSFGKPSPATQKNLEPLYKSFEEAGVELKFFTAQMTQKGKPGYLHAKTIVVDDKKAWMGSVNGSSTSLDKNREYGIFFNQRARVKYLQGVMSKDFADAKSESWKEAFECKNDRVGGAGEGKEEEKTGDAI